uniref:ShKT domain-containing protein n=1 Tax=Syphacia muris TaxID=451379 RepID=A0A0N5ADM6_9BILA
LVVKKAPLSPLLFFKTNFALTINQCRDKRTDCEQWASEGFCDSPLHSSKQKRYYCAKSCNLCDQ